ncbi:MAG: histidine kinase dimerization/phosphoacceptor domain -containing protein [Flavobacteriaceae bacterium]
MKKLIGINFTTLFICYLAFCPVLAQDTISDENSLFEKFRKVEKSSERFKFFFDTPNRYIENSAYDWQQTVNRYINTAQKVKDTSAIRHYRLIQAQISYDIGNYFKSLALAKELNKEDLNLTSKTILLDLMDQNYAQLAMYSEQIEIRKEKKKLGIVKNPTFYDIYSNLGLHRKAMREYIEQVQKDIDDKDYFAKAEFYNNVGTYLRLDKSAPTALINYKKAKGYVEVYLNDVTKKKSENDIIKGYLLKAVAEGNIGKCYVQLKEYKTAIPYLDSSITKIKEYKIGMFSSEIVENSLEIAECYLQLGDYEKATDYLSDDSGPRKTSSVLKKNRLLALYYDKTKNFEDAVRYLKKNIRIRDSININESELRKQQLATVMSEEMANTRTMMEDQKLALEHQRNKMQAQDEKINLVFISLVFTLLGFAGLVYAYLKSIKNQRVIAKQKHIIEKSLIEKDSLLKEIHHRVKNNLQMVSSLLSLQARNTKSKAAIVALEEGKSRVKAMALIHQKLYQNDDLSVIEMQGYIESLINSVQAVYKKGGHNINITIDAEGVELDIDRAIPFGLILNELVSNSFKYAFPVDAENGKIYIHIRKMGGKEGFFEYTDNGIGLPEDTDERASSSMGIRLMNRLANQLQTKLNIDKTTEGVRFWFNFL